MNETAIEIAIVKGIIWYGLCAVFGYLLGRLFGGMGRKSNDEEDEEE